MTNLTYSPLRTGPVLALLVAVAFSFAVGCGRTRQARSNVESAHPSPDTLSNGLPVALAGRISEWTTMWRKASLRFTPDSLVFAGRGPASLGRTGQPLDSSLVSDTDSSVIRGVMGEPSPNGRYVLVPDAYRALPDPAVQNAAGGEADEAAALLDYSRRTCDLFLVLGPSFTFDWGCWVDSTRFVLAGSGSDDDSSYFGFVSLYSMTENSATTWRTRPVQGPPREAYYAATQARLLARCRAWKAGKGQR